MGGKCLRPVGSHPGTGGAPRSIQWGPRARLLVVDHRRRRRCCFGDEAVTEANLRISGPYRITFYTPCVTDRDTGTVPPGLLSLSRRCRTVDRAPTIGTYRQGFWSYEARFILVPARTVREPALDTHEPNSAAEVPGLAFIFYLKPSSRVDRCQMSDVGGRGGRRVGRARCRLVVVGVSCVVQRAGHPTTSKEYICAEAPSLLARLGVRVR